jgi:sterol desaturase/sphingolipid hydroxylase (fatty acid hydroxylase superfamily)
MTDPTLVDRVLGADVDYITYAVPFFFLMIALEMVFVLLAGRDWIRFNDSITALACGTFEQVLGVFLKTFLFAGYIFVFNHFRLLEVSQFPPAAKWVAAVVLFLGVDFCFYWFHRFAHEWATPWATHVVHHSSEDLNLIVALRQSAFEDCIAWVFYLPLALLGFPPLWYAAMFSFNLIWQFWCHTRLVGKLGPIEWIFNTPSHHRVHHARNPQYLDKNYAGTLIIWDRMFGTYAEEEEEPVYGITKPLASWNPFWANFHYWVELADLSWRAPYWSDKVRVWFKPLGWTPRGIEAVRYARPVTPDIVIKYNAKPPRSLNAYIFLQFVLTALVGQYVLVASEGETQLAHLALPAGLVFWGLLNFGGIFEMRRWGYWSELARVAAASGSSLMLAQRTEYAAPLTLVILLLTGGSLVWLIGYRHLFRARPFVVVGKTGYRDELANPVAPHGEISLPTNVSEGGLSAAVR